MNSVPIAGEPLILWSWVFDHLGEIGSQLLQHVELTIIAVVLGFAISLPLGIWSHRRRFAAGPVTIVAGLLYTIPSLALFALLIPITGLSNVTVEVALVSYTLLILIRNIVAGLSGVPDDVKDAGRGMGLSDRQILWRVEVPLASPAIVAGIRVATVSTIGLVTVGGWIGRGGLGKFIFEGLAVFFNTEILLGAVLTVALAQVADLIILRGQRILAPWSRSGAADLIRVPPRTWG
jgi:osmoprotectant transport system permease protein